MLETIEEVKAALADARGFSVVLGGQKQKMHYVGSLATVLGLTSADIREWVGRGILPQTPFMFIGKGPRGRRQLYLEKQIITVWSTYKTYRTAWPNRSIKDTGFRDEILRAYESLAAEYRTT